MDVRALAVETADAAIGRSHRPDEALGRTGGPAGNAKLTAWTGILLLILFLAELVTVLDVRGLLSWHVVIGVLLVPPALLKTATTGWRMIGYYLGRRTYRRSGPPPMLLRLLGPFVVASTLAVLGTGVALVLAGPASSRGNLLEVAGFGVGLLMLHKASFVVWAVATGLHVLARTVPALRLTLLAQASGPVAGRALRLAAITLTMAVAAGAAVLILGHAAPWRTEPGHLHHRPGATRTG
jgi:hypothetical protein